MTWLDKLKAARKVFAEAKEDSEAVVMFDAIILLSEAIEEVGRHAKVPLIDWDKPQP